MMKTVKPTDNGYIMWSLVYRNLTVSKKLVNKIKSKLWVAFTPKENGRFL